MNLIKTTFEERTTATTTTTLSNSVESASLFEWGGQSELMDECRVGRENWGKMTTNEIDRTFRGTVMNATPRRKVSAR